MPEFHRRDFLKIVGASAGAAAAAGCSDPVQKLIPYVVQPEEITPGLPVHYASTCQECATGCGIHVKTREGRPVKLEGNPDHPINRGSLCARGQASIGRTYHPDRFHGPMERRGGELVPISWEEAIAALAGKLRSAGAKSWILGDEVGPTLSATLDRVVDALGMGGRVVYDPLAPEALREASRELFGSPAEPRFDLSKADLIVDFGSDFLIDGSSPVEHARQLAEARDADHAETRNTKLVSIGPRLSMTASAADEWIAAKPGSEGLIAAALAGAAGRDEGAKALLPSVSIEQAAAAADVPAETLQRLAAALAKASNPVSLPPGPALSSRRARDVAGAVLLLNASLGAVGKTVHFPAEAPATRRASYRGLLELIDAVTGGQVEVLLVHGANPVYSVPAAAGFGAALEAAGDLYLVSFASIRDETAERADLVLPDHSALESWGDAEPRAGVRGLVQPSLRPLFQTRALADSLLDATRVIGADVPVGDFRTLVSEAWGGGASFRNALGRGGRFASESGGASAPAEDARAVNVEEPVFEEGGDFTVLACPSPTLSDGRGANMPWLQEAPDPITKVTWQSWAEISSAAAERLGGLQPGDLVQVKTETGAVELPVFPRGGIRDDVVAINMGQGHTTGTYATGHGVNVLSLLPRGTDEAGGPAWLVARAAIQATGGHRRLAFLQTSQNQRGRLLAPAVSLADLASGAAHVEDYNEHATPPVSAGGDDDGHGASEGHGGGHDEHHLKPFVAATDSEAQSQYRWGMAIDLDRCTGCNACIAACYIENNIPVVGEEEVLRGRNMSWLRIERWVGDGNNEGGSSLPIIPEEHSGEVDIRNGVMLCQQCGAAPCEPVCPVIATYHSEDGPQRHDLQPLHRHPLLLEQLPLQSAALQLVRLRTQQLARPHAAHGQPRRHRPRPGRHGKVHLLRAAHRQRAPNGEGRGAPDRGWRGDFRLRPDLPDPGHHLRQSPRRAERGGETGRQQGARLPRAPRTEHEARCDLSLEGPTRRGGGLSDDASSAVRRIDRRADAARPGSDRFGHQPRRHARLHGAAGRRLALVGLALPRDPRGRRGCLGLSDLRRPRHRRVLAPDLLGRLHRHLRVLGGYRTRRHVDFRDSLPVPSEVAQRHQPQRRGDDGLRGLHRAALPRYSRRAHLEGLLHSPLPESARVVGELQEPAPVGHLRDFHLYADLDHLLLRGAVARLGDRPRPLDRLAPGALRRPLPRLAGHLPPVEGAHPHRAPPLGARHATGALGAQRRVLGLRDVDRARLARHNLRALLRGGGHLLGASPWC